MYLVWNLQDCFFRALAARYWAFVPCGGEAGTSEKRRRWGPASGAGGCWRGPRRAGRSPRAASVACYLQVVKDEEERLRGQPLVKLHGVGVRRRHLVVERQGGARVPHQVLPEKRQTEASQQQEGWRLPGTSSSFKEEKLHSRQAARRFTWLRYQPAQNIRRVSDGRRLRLAQTSKQDGADPHKLFDDPPQGPISHVLVTSIDRFRSPKVGESAGSPSDSAQMYFPIHSRYF